MLRSSNELHHEKLLSRLTNIFVREIDIHVFVPLLPFPVKLDGIQPADTQQDVQNMILYLYESMGISYRTLKTTCLDSRVDELIELIKNEQESIP